MELIYHEDSFSKDGFKELSDYVDSLYKEHEQLDYFVSKQEDAIIELMDSLLLEENISESTKTLIHNAKQIFYGRK